MPAEVFTDEMIDKLMPEITESLEKYKLLCRIEREGYILNGRSLDRQLFGDLQRLAEIGLVDPGYDGAVYGEPHQWVSNGNGRKTLARFHLAGQRD
jgi:hypothetical protein